ncbi:MAG: CYTH domain-containing protein [Bacilli bacterium]|nr:CYTH domain-containing protein [Bacilli bacterium]
MSVKELEERVMLTKNQYLNIEDFLKSTYENYRITHQKNRYLDDNKRTINSLRHVLRIRSFTHSKNRELTYKVDGVDGDIEYNQILTYYWFRKLTQESRLLPGEVSEALLKDNVDINSLKVLVDLRTRRLEVSLKDYTIVLDANLYNDIVDYNLEVESNISKEHAKKVILDFCKKFDLTYQDDYVVKSLRALNSIKS